MRIEKSVNDLRWPTFIATVENLVFFKVCNFAVP